MDIKKVQKEIFENKIKKGFNTTDISIEFCHLYGEIGEAWEAYYKKKNDLNYELADIAIYLLGLSEMLDIDLESAIKEKMAINAKRVYKDVNGVKIKTEN